VIKCCGIRVTGYERSLSAVEGRVTGYERSLSAVEGQVTGCRLREVNLCALPELHCPELAVPELVEGSKGRRVEGQVRGNPEQSVLLFCFLLLAFFKAYKMQAEGYKLTATCIFTLSHQLITTLSNCRIVELLHFLVLLLCGKQPAGSIDILSP